MTLDEFRSEMEGYLQSAEEEAKALKDPYVALDRWRTLYTRFDSEEKIMADQVVAEWVLSTDETVRFIALTLVTDFKISRALSALQQLASRLAKSDSPGAPYELKKVLRIVADIDPVARFS